MTQIAYEAPNTLLLKEHGGNQHVDKPKQNKILVVDDEPDTVLLIKSILQREGYEVFGASNGLDALKKVPILQPSLILTDMMMPEMDGWQAIQKIKEISDAPIIILSALGQTESIVRALALGADDYITKPFDHTEVIARVESVLRRLSGNSKISRLGIDSIDLVLDLDTREVFHEGKCFQLTGKMFDVLKMLMQNAPRLVTYAELTDTVWGEDSPAVRNRLKYLIYLLRQLFLESGVSADFISNIGRLGYKITTN